MSKSKTNFYILHVNATVSIDVIWKLFLAKHLTGLAYRHRSFLFNSFLVGTNNELHKSMEVLVHNTNLFLTNMCTIETLVLRTSQQIFNAAGYRFPRFSYSNHILHIISSLFIEMWYDSMIYDDILNTLPKSYINNETSNISFAIKDKRWTRLLTYNLDGRFISLTQCECFQKN